MAEKEPDRNGVEQLNEADDSHSVSATDSQISVDVSVLENSIAQQMTAMATEVKETVLSLKEYVEMRFIEFDKRIKKTELQLKEYGRKIGLYNPGGASSLNLLLTHCRAIHNAQKHSMSLTMIHRRRKQIVLRYNVRTQT